MYVPAETRDRLEHRGREGLTLQKLLAIAVACSLGTAIGGLCTRTLAEPVTYQGRLNEEGAPASGQYDFSLEFYAQETGGSPVAPAQTFLGIDVEEGLFTLPLEFNADSLSATPTWVKMLVRKTNGGTLFRALTPRQPLGAAPYAIVDLNEPWTRDGDSIHFIGGKVRVGRDFSIGSEAFGVGTDTSGFGGMYVSTTGDTGFPFYGYSAGGDIDAYQYFDSVHRELRTWIDNGTAVRISSNSVGINATAPSARGLHVYGDLRVLNVSSDPADAVLIADPATAMVQVGNASRAGDLSVHGSVDAEGFAYREPRVRRKTISFAAFNQGEDTSGGSSIVRDEDSLLAYVVGGDARLVAPIELPDTARIQDMFLYASDLEPAYRIGAAIYRHGFSFGGKTVVMSASTPRDENSFPNIPIDASYLDFTTTDVNNNSFIYWLEIEVYNLAGSRVAWTGDTDLSVRAVVVEYTVAAPD